MMLPVKEGAPARLGEHLILMPLARGKHSRVFVARGAPHITARKPIALKQLETPFDAGALKRGQLLMAYESPFFPRIYEVGEAFVAMELLDGWPLSELIENRDRPFLFEDAARIMTAVLSGLVSLQALRDPLAADRVLVHRGAAPRKVMVAPDGRTKLLGFDRAGSAEGTLGYAAPEQIVAGDVGPAADVWSAAALFVELLTGMPYLPPGSVQEMRLAALDPPPLDPKRLPNDAPPRLGALLQVALDPDPLRRLPAARDFLDALLGIAPDATQPIGDVAALVGDTLWNQREKSATRIARAETMMPFHQADESFERWDDGSQVLDPTRLNPKLRARSSITEPGVVSQPIEAPAPPPPAEPDTKPLAPRPVRASAPEISVRAMPRRGSALVPASLLGALVAIGAIAGFALREPPIEVAPIADTPLPEPGATRAEVVPEPEAPPEKPAENPQEKAAPPPIKTKRPPIATPPPKTPIVETKAPPPDDVQDRIRALMNRARAVKRRAADGTKSAAIDRLLGRLVVEASARDREQRDARLLEIERELTNLEQ